jgi:diketogulonate reductase-like aldo/keto reductase
MQGVASQVDGQVIESHGARIPAIGLGTMTLKDQVCVELVEAALHLGYRHLDTAQMYGNEREVGEGLRVSGVKRDSVFITTKIWPSHFAPRDLERAARACLERLTGHAATVEERSCQCRGAAACTFYMQWTATRPEA